MTFLPLILTSLISNAQPAAPRCTFTSYIKRQKTITLQETEDNKGNVVYEGRIGDFEALVGYHKPSRNLYVAVSELVDHKFELRGIAMIIDNKVELPLTDPKTQGLQVHLSCKPKR